MSPLVIRERLALPMPLMLLDGHPQLVLYRALVPGNRGNTSALRYPSAQLNIS